MVFGKRSQFKRKGHNFDYDKRNTIVELIFVATVVNYASHNTKVTPQNTRVNISTLTSL